MTRQTRNVLFLCTGNSARSILAEGLLNHLGNGAFRGFSAGSFPKGTVHPLALETLSRLRIPVAGLRNKSWNEFAGPNALVMDFIVTVCDQAAGEVCPIWPGKPISAHWGMPDPAAATGAEAIAAFAETARVLEQRIRHFLGFAAKGTSASELRNLLAEAGRLTPAVKS